ncbi:MAG: LptF/LptG family permease [Bacteroidota bacterium]
MRLKKLDNLLIKSFLPPFVVTFFIALFVLVMQTLWLYIDDIAGKGIGFFLMVELVGYMSVSMIPMALPVAVLISSVMVMGNLAERYELSSIKSAGVSLWRTIRPLMVVTLTIGLFSFFCSNYFIPVSNLKFKSRLHDIKNQKPALSMEESLFNQDFQGYSIRLGDKMADNQTIRDVLLYDNREANKGMLNMVAADSGQMYGSADGKFFVMHLFDGSQVSEPKPTNKGGKRNYPMMRATYQEWTKVFDLNEFELDRTDENLFKSHHTMLSNRQLLIAIDSIDLRLEDRQNRIDEQTNRHYHFWEKRALEKKKKEREEESKRKKEEAEKKKKTEQKNDPAAASQAAAERAKKERLRAQAKRDKNTAKQNAQKKKNPAKTKNPQNTNKPPKKTQKKKKDQLEQQIDQPIETYESIAFTFKEAKRKQLFESAKSNVRTIKDQAASSIRSIKKTRETRVKHVFEYHSKYSLAIACFIFLFVGAPMGAIVRKGGFGWPLLISIIFFMLFIVISIFSKNIAERFVIDAVLAAWMNCLVIFPMGLILTYWAMQDMGWSQIVDFFKSLSPTAFIPKKIQEPTSL